MLDWIRIIEIDYFTAQNQYLSEPHNNPGWYAPDEGDSTHAEMNFGVPLIMKALPVFPTRNHTKVTKSTSKCFPFSCFIPKLHGGFSES